MFNTTTVSAEDDFFALGGNSLTAVKFISQVEDNFGIEALSPEALYSDASFKNILATITQNVEAKLIALLCLPV